MIPGTNGNYGRGEEQICKLQSIYFHQPLVMFMNCTYVCDKDSHLRFEVLSSVVMKNSSFLCIMPCSSLKVNWCFVEIYHLLLQDRRMSRALLAIYCLAYYYYYYFNEQLGLQGYNNIHIDVRLSYISHGCTQKRDHVPNFCYIMLKIWPPLWSSGQTPWLLIHRSWVRFPALPIFLCSSGSGTGSTQPREDKWGATWKKSSSSGLENWD
jgi:hypothetical protein